MSGEQPDDAQRPHTRRFRPLAKGWAPPEIDTTVAHPARIYDYLLGGKDNFPADRQAAEAVVRIFPSARTQVRENRRFLGRAVRYLTAEAGIRQFLDIGTGIPTAGNTHEVAQTIAPTTRVVYVDNDPIVLAHSRALLTSTPEGTTAYLNADFRDPHTTLTTAHHTLDFTQPIALLLVALVNFVADEDDPMALISAYREALPPGSYIALSHATGDFEPEATAAMIDTYRQRGANGYLRGFDAVEEYFAELTLVEPGIVPVAEWRNPVTVVPSPIEAQLYAGVGFKSPH
jgi:hypothetical protein